MKKIATPRYEHCDFEHVYEPAEDSFLFLDALEEESEELDFLNPRICVEVGSGSGILTTGFASLFPQCFVIATDLNAKACKATKETFTANKIPRERFEIVNDDCLTASSPRLEARVDVVLCNPPYVATEDVEAESRDLAAAWAGGIGQGRNIVNRLLSLLPTLLTPDKGRCYLLLEQCNQPEEVIDFALREHNLKSKLVKSRKAGREHLFVFKFQL